MVNFFFLLSFFLLFCMDRPGSVWLRPGIREGYGAFIVDRRKGRVRLDIQ
jgi:hypothetical protein